MPSRQVLGSNVVSMHRVRTKKNGAFLPSCATVNFLSLCTGLLWLLGVLMEEINFSIIIAILRLGWGTHGATDRASGSASARML